MSIETELAKVAGEDNVSVRSVDRVTYSRDVWPRNTIRLQGLDLPDRPQVVVWPGSVEEVQEVVRIAGRTGTPVIPMGGGSGVCGGTVALGGRGIVVDLKRMNRILGIDDEPLTVTAQSGVIGELLERELNRKGYTMGHFPSSIYCSTFGGWLSTRAAGQLSAKYGKIEDMVVSIQVVLPDGEVLETRQAPRKATGPEFMHAFVGAEGTLGIITAATCRIWPYPESRRFQAYSFQTVEDGLEAMRRMMQAELRPACVRLYDPVDTFFSKASRIMPSGHKEKDEKQKPPQKQRNKESSGASGLVKKALPYLMRPGLVNPVLSKLESSKLVLTFEGDPEITRLEKSMARGICAACGGRDLGEDPARHWWDKRYKVSYTMQVMFEMGVFVDTIEVATVWDNLANLYYGMRESISRHAFVMAHFSHAYPQGCSIYYSVAATGKDTKKKLQAYDRIWEAALDQCVERGGSISHHHGVGVLKARWLESEQGGSSPMLVALKKSLDPMNLMNPGKMGM